MNGDKINVDIIIYLNEERTSRYDYVKRSALDGFVCAHHKETNKLVYINSDTIDRIITTEKE